MPTTPMQLSVLVAVVAAVATVLLTWLPPAQVPSAGECDGQTALPAGFLDVESACAAAATPGIALDMRYAGWNNFVGRPIPGYAAARCLLTRQAAAAVCAAHADAVSHGYSLLVYDCYRPQRSVDAFISWSLDPADQAMKQVYYPSLSKHRLFDQGYVARRSGHSRGSTLDLTLRNVKTLDELDMGTRFDFFHAASHTDHPDVTPLQRRNRDMLRDLMHRHGFVNYPKEWWHYTLADEPYPDRYFDHPICSAV